MSLRLRSKRVSSGRRRGEDGQTVVFVAVLLIVLIAVLGLVVDVGELYLTQRHLQTAADAAALAAAQDLPGSSVNACNYSASPQVGATCTVDGVNVPLSTNGDNYNSRYGNVLTTAAVKCVSVASAGTGCQTGAACNSQLGYAPAGSTTNLGCNAIKVTETTGVKPFFMQILGFGSQTVSASSTAGIAGGTPHPLNVEMIDDTTASMQTADTCGGTPTDVPSSQSGKLTQEDCAKAGIRALLAQLYPCQPNLSTCGTAVTGTDNIATPLDMVGMAAFPGLNGITTGNGVSQELNCSQDLGSGNVTYGAGANYQIVPFSSDFRYSDATTSDPLATLNPNSNLVRSVYWPGDGCPNGGYPIPGGSTTSISGGGTTSANNTSPPTIQVGGSQTAINSGISQGNSVNTTNTSTSGITTGNSKNVSTSALTIGGGPNSGSTNDKNTQTANATGITIARPATHLANDFLLLTVTAQGASVTSSYNICPSTATTGWTLVDQKRVSGTVIQETYSSTRSSALAENYTFNFFSGACSGGAGNVTLAASAVVVRYTNVASVDTANGVNGATGAPTNSNFAGSAASTPWALGGASYASTIGTSATYSNTPRYVSLSTNCTSTTNAHLPTGCDNTAVTANGNITGFTFNFTGAGDTTNTTTTYTVVLYLNTTGASGASAATTLTCTIGHSSTGCTAAGSVAVTAGQTIQLRVTRSAGGTSIAATASASATETPPLSTTYVSLSNQCANASATICNVTTIGTPGTLTSAGLTFAANVPTGDSFTVTLFKNAAASASTCTIAAGAATCTIAPALAVVAGNTLELRVAQTAGTTAFTTTATTAAVESVSTLVAPPVTTAQANEQVVRLFGTGATQFATGTNPAVAIPPVTVSSTSTATGVDDAAQATAGTTGPESADTTTPDNWVAQTVALIPTVPSSITLSTATSTIPTDYQGNTGDFLLVSIAVQGSGVGVVCSPTTGGAWNTLTPVQKGSGATELTHATFWTTLSTATSDTFTFYPSTCGTGTPVPALASAVATTYNGVNVAAVATAATVTSAGNASGSALTAMQNATSGDNYEVVNLFATTDAFSTVTPPSPAFFNQAGASSGAPDIGESAGLQQASGNQAPQATATATPGTGTWTAQTVDLMPLLNSSITLSTATSTLPSDYQGNTGDLLLVSIAVQGLGTGVICSPTDGTWSALYSNFVGSPANPVNATTAGSGPSEVTQVTFWTTASTAASDTFTFYPTSSCKGTPVQAAASAVATTYDGVNVALTPVVTNGGNSSGTALAAPQNPTTTANEEVVNLFATTDAFGGAIPAFSTNAQTSPSSVWTNIGESAGIQPVSGNQPTQAKATAVHSAAWTAQTVDLVPLLSSTITVTPPSGYTGGGANLMLVSISVANLGNGSICSPDATEWSPVPLSTTSPVKYTVTQGDLTQETFYTSTSEDASDTFTFYSKPTCNGNFASVGASAVAVYYTGVNTAAPFDGTPAFSSGSTAALNPAAVTTSAGDELVGLYGSDASTLALTGSTILASGNGLVPSTGATNAAPAAGSHAPSSATTTPTSGNWTTETIALAPLGGTGVLVTRPAGAAADDFVLVTVTANGLNAAAGNNICAPNDGTWTALTPSTTGAVPLITSGAISQETFYSFRPTANAEKYEFNFTSGACPGGGASTPISGSASAVAIRYAGVNPITPIDTDATTFLPSYNFSKGSSTSPTPSAVNPARTGDWVVALYGTGATSMTVSCTGTNAISGGTYQGFVQGNPAGTASETGECANSSPSVTKSFTPPKATTSNNPWITQTIALESASGGCGANCEYGMEDPGGAGTNYALPIDAAQAALHGLSATRPTAQNVIILLSDGDATTNAPGGSNPCQAGITEAEKAELAGTWVFAIAYGANYDQTGKLTAKSCTLDTSGPLKGLSAQCAMILIAHNVQTDPALGSDVNAESTLCNSPANTYVPSDPAHRYFNQAVDSSLETVFNEVGVALTTPRLISNDAS